MNRRSFLLACGSSLAAPRRRAWAQTPLGKLVWTEAGGVWLRELPDGPPAILAAGEGLRSPRFSPSGEWIAYRNPENQIFVAGRDGREGASFEGHESTWLLHEDRLAISRDSDVLVYGPGNRWRSPEASWKDAGIGPFRPDGRQYAAVRIHQHPADRYGLNQDRAELYVGEENRTSRVLIPQNEGGIHPCCWTRDGKQVIYWRAGEWSGSIWSDGVDLYAIPAAGGPERKLGVSSLVHADMVDLAPTGGNRLVAVSGRSRETWAAQQLVLIDLDTGAKRELTPPEIAAQGPAWSPDGQRIAYFAGPDAELADAKAEAGTTMKIVNPDGSVTTKLRMPDRRIGIGGGEEAHRFLQLRKIWVLDPAGAAPPRQLTRDPYYRDEEPLWSADSSHILFARMDYQSQASLWLMESSGSNARQLCALKLNSDSPVEESWFGYYGYIDWRTAFDWHR